MSDILRKLSPFTIVILVLAVIGLIVNMTQLLIPILVLGLIFGLYFFQMRVARKKVYTKPFSKRDAASMNKTKPRKPMPFRVIEGGKDDDNLPKYH